MPLERKEIFENSKQHFYSCTDYLFVLKWLRFEGCDFRRSGTLTSSNVNFCKDHRDKTEVPDPLAVENLISYKLNNIRE